MTGRSERALGEVVGEIANAGQKARHLAGDVRDPAHLAAAVERAVSVFGGLDIAIAAASLGARGPLALGSGLADTARDILETNVLGAYQTFDAAARAMKGPGRLVAVRSTLATGDAGLPGYAAHSAANAGLLGLVRSAAVELASRGITANALLHVRPVGVDPDDVPPEQLAELCVYLCTSAADGITGQSIAMSGATPVFA